MEPRGRVLNSSRKKIWEYQEGKWLNRYSSLHPAFVSKHLRIAEGLTVTKKELRDIYKEWMLANPTPFGDPDMNVDMRDMHNLYLYLLASHGIEEDGETFHGVGIRAAAG